MRKSSLIFLLAMAFVVTTVVSAFSASVTEPCFECEKGWYYGLKIEIATCFGGTEQVEGDVCPCPTFDYEGGSAYGDYCSSPLQQVKGVVFKICDCEDPDVFTVDQSYGIKMEILEPSTGVYFTAQNDTGVDGQYSFYDCDAEYPCGAAAAGQGYVTVSSYPDPATAGYNKQHCPVPCDATPYAFTYEALDATQELYDLVNGDYADEDCCMDCSGDLKVKGIATTCKYPFLQVASPILLIDLPTFVYDPKEIAAGTTVRVKITLIGDAGGDICTTCNDLCSCIVDVGTFGCPEISKDPCKLCFPYFTAAGGDWWSGFALTNSGSSAADVTMTFYAGGVSTSVDVAVPAYSVVVQALSMLDLSALPAGEAIYAQASGMSGNSGASLSGFAIMGDGAQAYGYLSKVGMCGCTCCDDGMY